MFRSYAGMMELADMRDLGSRAATRWGSSPHTRTTARRGQAAAYFLSVFQGPEPSVRRKNC